MVRLSLTGDTGKIVYCHIVFKGLILNEQYNLSLFFKAVIAQSYRNFLVTFLLVACSAVMKANIIGNNRVLYKMSHRGVCCIV